MNTITIGTPCASVKIRCEMITGTRILVIDPLRAAYELVCQGIKSNGGPVSSFDVITPAALSAIREVFSTLAPELIPDCRKIPLIKTIQLVSELTGNRLGLGHAKSITDIPATIGGITKEEVANVKLELESVDVVVWA